VQKHRGNIILTSQPGRTVFEVWLPVNFEKDSVLENQKTQAENAEPEA